ncbi:MAG: Crp/Fnr family transcriptional regulator [Sphingomonas sp.]|uniref:Crp/Fnr family transcriptional regulator n=1 Tax=Sphingomonas sp. TaxID=28214 RepID=UPI001ACB5FC3|nr:Crp/Fnr family transcriptional regulator [Sphingomonas sp.]MBN8808670.1 Crp/Fnr family transcriptional regulator [Sphingomonas sp.]
MTTNFPTYRLTATSLLTPADVARIQALGEPPQRIARYGVIRSEGSSDRSVYFLLEGWVAASMLLWDGERQIVKLHLPGDMLGSTSMCFDSAVDTVTALTPAVVSRIPLERIGALMMTSPAIAVTMLLAAQEERTVLMDRLAAVGRASALARVAALLIELSDRLHRIGHGDDDGFDLALTQEQIGDLLALTPVHVNRMLRQLQELGLVARRGRRVRLIDPSALRRLAAVRPRTVSTDVSWLGRDMQPVAIPPVNGDGPLRR